MNLSKRKEHWMIWNGIYDSWIRLIRVDISFKKTNYKHTYCIELTYSDGSVDTAPPKPFMKKSEKIENKMIDAINEHYHNKIFFVGSDMFGGKRILVFVSNYEFSELGWAQFVAKTITDEDMDAVTYYNDNMQYFNGCLYPDFIREK